MFCRKKMFDRWQCDYPGCDGHKDGRWRSEEEAFELVRLPSPPLSTGYFIESEFSWIALLGDDKRPRVFCDEHTLKDTEGFPIRFSPKDKGSMPANAELYSRYQSFTQTYGTLPPVLPKPECEDTILQVLKEPLRLTENQLAQQALNSLADAALDMGEEPAYSFLLGYKMGWNDAGGVIIEDEEDMVLLARQCKANKPALSKSRLKDWHVPQSRLKDWYAQCPQCGNTTNATGSNTCACTYCGASLLPKELEQ